MLNIIVILLSSLSLIFFLDMHARFLSFFCTSFRIKEELNTQTLNFTIWIISIGGRLTGVSGTSASAPAFAGMLSLINAALILRGSNSHKCYIVLRHFLYCNTKYWYCNSPYWNKTLFNYFLNILFRQTCFNFFI